MNSPLVRAFAVFFAAFVLLALAGRLLSLGAPSGGSKGLALGGGYVARLGVEGVITASDTSESFFATGEASSIGLCEDLYAIADDPAVKAVVLRVNSPGGSAAASDEIYRAVQAVREAGKPVVVSMGDVAASGGYYIAAPADWIVANGATLTGSIGVVFQLMNIEKLGEKIGVSDVTLHAGKYKDIGNPWRPMTAEEKAILTELLTDVHEQFIAAVDEGRRNLSAEQVRALATGTIFTGTGALKAGLVDEVGGLAVAEAKARELAGLSEDAPVEDYGGGGFWDELFAVRGSGIPADMAQLAQHFGADWTTVLSRGLYLNETLRDLTIR